MDREHKSHGQSVKDIYVYPLIQLQRNSSYAAKSIT